MKHLTVRNLPADVAEALHRERRERNTSLNQTVIALLRQALGVGGTRSNGLARFAGGWTSEELEEFQRATKPFSEIDPEMWR